jgi:hypothetical protein
MVDPGTAGEAAGLSSNAASKSAGSQDDPFIWHKMKPASFEIPGMPKVIFPIWERVEGSHGIRAVARAVPWVDGEQLDETGLTAKEWATEHPFINDLCDLEPGIGKDPPLYPDRLELLETVLEQRKTGTLNLPWRRNIRCKALSWRRVASVERQDCEILSVQWKEDNENKLANPSSSSGVRANLAYQVEQARFACEREGIGGFAWEDVTLLASRLETVVAAPGAFLQDVAQKAQRFERAVDSIMGSFSRATGGRDQLLGPEGAEAYRYLFGLKELASHAESEARGLPLKVVTWPAPFDGSIWAICQAPGWQDQDPQELLRINPRIPDPNWIPKGTPIKVLVP